MSFVINVSNKLQSIRLESTLFSLAARGVKVSTVASRVSDQGSIPWPGTYFDEILSLIQLSLAISSFFVINFKNDVLQR